jgi:hypothetical protein
MIRTVLGVVIALLASAAPAPAATRASQVTQPASRLTLTYVARAGHADAVKLTCNPTGGPHPEAARACALLRTTGADPGRITPAPVMCVLLYAPVTARISGTWRGSRVAWSHQYGNSCEMTRATGVLFRF